MKRPKHYYRKNREYLFVDGYNILNHWNFFKELLHSDLEEARRTLMDVLAEYSHFSGISIILVFDGYLVKKSPGSEFYYKGIRVVYTRELETADHYIEKELSEIGRHRNVRVATSDNMEQQMILAKGGKRVSARELEFEILRGKEGIRRKSKELKEDSPKLTTLDENTIEQLKKLKKKL
ncbi:MAG: NYN domain-containing protein [Tissierellia bacterium]|nr:NYN domain-containing protein [Tissierellia bacterium]